VKSEAGCKNSSLYTVLIGREWGLKYANKKRITFCGEEFSGFYLVHFEFVKSFFFFLLIVDRFRPWNSEDMNIFDEDSNGLVFEITPRDAEVHDFEVSIIV
jgi:hypothetical protein